MRPRNYSVRPGSSSVLSERCYVHSELSSVQCVQGSVLCPQCLFCLLGSSVLAPRTLLCVPSALFGLLRAGLGAPGPRLRNQSLVPTQEHSRRLLKEAARENCLGITALCFAWLCSLTTCMYKHEFTLVYPSQCLQARFGVWFFVAGLLPAEHPPSPQSSEAVTAQT